MFLALTADQRFWDTSQEILFLGEWCKLYSQKAEWSKLKYKTLPDVRDTITDHYEKLLYCEKLYEKYISLLAIELNKLHSVNYSERYWRIVIGPWLRTFIQSIYVKYLTIKMAEAEGVVTGTIIPISDPNKVTPYDCTTFKDWIESNDEYNQYLFGCIIKKRSAISYHETNIELSLKQKICSNISLAGNLDRIGPAYKFICALNDVFSLYFPLKFNSILFINSFLSNVDTIKLCLKLRQFPHIIERIPDQYDIHPFSKDMRRKIILPLSETNEFESLLNVLIPKQIPKGIIENYEEVSLSIKKYEGNVQIIYTAAGMLDLGYSILLANIAEKGGIIIETQHGGNFGSVQYNLFESIQKEQSNLFLSWGWLDSSQNVLPMSTGSKFHQSKKIANMYNKNGGILLIEYKHPRYVSNILLTYPNGSKYLYYINENLEFCSLLSPTAVSLLNIRPSPNIFGWGVRQRWADKYPNLKRNSEGKSFYEQLKESRLAISTSNSTTMLECFVSNIPTILFWNPEFEKLRSSAQPYYDKLHEVGILHYTPQSAAKLVNEICDDPMKWWMQPDIQQAKDEFCYQFARTSDDWMDQLADVLKSQLALAKKEMKARNKK